MSSSMQPTSLISDCPVAPESWRNPEPQASNTSWFALRIRSNFERLTALYLRERGYQEFFPTYEIKSRWSDRVKAIEKPLFPGYVFCRFDSNSRFPIVSAPGVLHIVGLGKQPVPIDEREIAAVRATLQSGLPVQPWPYLQIGERVVVDRGPLEGVQGVVTHLKGACRLVVSITLLQRSVAAEIDRDWITPVRQCVC